MLESDNPAIFTSGASDSIGILKKSILFCLAIIFLSLLILR